MPPVPFLPPAAARGLHPYLILRTAVIFPCLTDTPLVGKRPAPTPPEVLARALQPEDVAKACLFAASLPPRARVPELMLVPAGL